MFYVVIPAKFNLIASIKKWNTIKDNLRIYLREQANTSIEVQSYVNF